MWFLSTGLWLYCDVHTAHCPPLLWFLRDSHSGHGPLSHTNKPNSFGIGVPVGGLRRMGHQRLQISVKFCQQENSPVVAFLTVLSPILNWSLSMLKDTKVSNPSPITSTVPWIAHSWINRSISPCVVHSLATARCTGKGSIGLTL